MSDQEIKNILIESVWIMRWNKDKTAMSAVLSPEEAEGIADDIIERLNNEGYRIVHNSESTNKLTDKSSHTDLFIPDKRQRRSYVEYVGFKNKYEKEILDYMLIERQIMLAYDCYLEDPEQFHPNMFADFQSF